MRGAPEKRPWKNDRQWNGAWDALIDLGSHVADICLYLMSDIPVETNCWTSYRNSAAPHRDTHVHLNMKFNGDRRGIASISKTMHGATNDFEYTVIGTRAAATWRFTRPDEIELGSGAERRFLYRASANPSSSTLPFHGLGWLEGYVEITRQTLRRASGLDFSPVPTLKESLTAMQVLLNAKMDKQKLLKVANAQRQIKKGGQASGFVRVLPRGRPALGKPYPGHDFLFEVAHKCH
jgi:predicted dehydrogenase